MGNGETKSSHGMTKLTDAEVQALQAAVNLGEIKGRLTEDVIVKKLSFPSNNPALLAGIYAFIAHGKKHIGIEELKAAYESVKFGILDDHVKIISFLLDHAKQSKEQFCKWIVQSAEAISPGWKYWAEIHCQVSENSQNSLVNFLIHEHNGDTFPDVETWLSRRPLITSLLIALFRNGLNCPLDEDCETVLFPKLIDVNPKGPSPTIMSSSEVLFLNSILPHDLKTEWRLLFTTSRHGQSFASLVAKILDHGPTVIIVKDTDGHVFGGFASVKWAIGPNFIGDQRCFLFSLKPKMSMYVSKGYNDHYMYLNQQQATLPNGLGMGGQHEYFGMWLDAEFGKGHSSKSCTTYGDYHQLSKNEKFEIEHLEVWFVGRPPRRDSDDEDGANPRSILDRDPGAKALLEMIDRGQHSEGLREPEPVD